MLRTILQASPSVYKHFQVPSSMEAAGTWEEKNSAASEPGDWVHPALPCTSSETQTEALQPAGLLLHDLPCQARPPHPRLLTVSWGSCSKLYRKQWYRHKSLIRVRYFVSFQEARRGGCSDFFLSFKNYYLNNTHTFNKYLLSPDDMPRTQQ